jgi:hypothetical protein
VYKHLFVAATLFSMFPLTVGAQSAAKPAEGAEYKVITVKSPRDGKPVHLLICKNGTAQCSYKWDQLCESGKAQNTNPLGGIGGDVPAFIRNGEGTPMRMFVCQE